MWKMKKKWFTGVANLTIVTPSKWLAELVKQSYLKEYPIQVIIMVLIILFLVHENQTFEKSII